jgi:hypothetical protein
MVLDAMAGVGAPDDIVVASEIKAIDTFGRQHDGSDASGVGLFQIKI